MKTGRQVALPSTAVHQDTEYAPERRLMAAVLLQAVQDYKLLRSWMAAPRNTERRVGHGVWLSRRAYRRLQQYLFGDAAPDHFYSAANICEHLDLPLAGLRAHLRDEASQKESKEAPEVRCPRCNASGEELEVSQDRAGRTKVQCLVCNDETEIDQ